MRHYADGHKVELVLTGKGNVNLWTEQFTAAQSGRIMFVEAQDGRQICQTNAGELEWIAQLKPSHAQRLAHEIGQNLSVSVSLKLSGFG